MIIIHRMNCQRCGTERALVSNGKMAACAKCLERRALSNEDKAARNKGSAQAS